MKKFIRINQSGFAHHLLGVVIIVALIAVMGLRVLTINYAAADPRSIFEWGKPVASGGPGNVPTVVQPSAATIDAGNYSDVVSMSDGTVWAWGRCSMRFTQLAGVKNVTQRAVDGNGSFAAIEQPGTDSACPTSSSVIGWSISKAPAVISK